MKKGLVLAFSLLLLCVAGCSNLKNVPIDAYVWKITVIQEKTKIQENQKGDVIACAPEFISSYKGAAEIDLTCEAQNGSFTITDARSNQSYKGQYRLEERSPEGTIYEIKLGEATGYAVTGMTTYLDNNQIPTFIINIGDYVLNFQSVSNAAENDTIHS